MMHAVQSSAATLGVWWLPLTLAAVSLGGCFTPPVDGGDEGSTSGEGSSSVADGSGTAAVSSESTSSATSEDPGESSTTSGAVDSTTDEPSGCGNGIVEEAEACDDANEDSTDGCLSDCTVPISCMAVLAHDPAASSGLHVIDSDGPGGNAEYDAWCDMDHAGGGWTLVVVSADDGHATWTWLNRELLTTDTFLVGNVAVLDEDYKSVALHLLSFSDLLFVHRPSDVWASYDGVGDGSSDVATFMASLPFPQCDLTTGYPMTDGELTTIGTSLCSTDLYFHAGDHDGTFGGQAYCDAFEAPSYDATYGPAWNAGGNNGCPMDDPSASSLGPSMLASYDGYPPEGIEDVEQDGRGFALGMGLTQPADRLEMYVR